MMQEREMREFQPSAGRGQAKAEIMGLMQVWFQICWTVYEDLPI